MGIGMDVGVLVIMLYPFNKNIWYLFRANKLNKKKDYDSIFTACWGIARGVMLFSQVKVGFFFPFNISFSVNDVFK